MVSISAKIDQAARDAAKRAADKAAGKTSSKKPLFLFPKPGYKASIRPLWSVDDCFGLMVHDKYSDRKEYKVNAVCAGETCEHCDTSRVMKDWELRAKDATYIPVFVYSVFCDGIQVTYEEEQENGQKVTKPVKGFRMIECFLYGKTYGLLNTFREYERDMKRSISACDWTYSQIGAGTTKTLTLMYKDPVPMQDALAKAVPSIDRFRQSILDARPPLVAVSNVQDFSDDAVRLEVASVPGEPDDYIF